MQRLVLVCLAPLVLAAVASGLVVSSFSDGSAYNAKLISARNNSPVVSKTLSAFRTRVTQPTTLKLRNIKDLQYHGEITIGGQSLLAIYDTGSFDVVTLSTLCTTCLSGATLYDSKQSPSFRSGGGKRVTQNFGSGSLRAQQDKDAVAIGGSQSAWNVKDMAFWQVVEHSMPFWNSEEGGQFSVIAGLCHTQYLPDEFDVGPYRDTLPGRLQLDRFAFCFEDDPGAPGWLTIGIPPNSAESPSSIIVPMVGGMYWLAKLTDVSLGDTQQAGFKESYGAVIDSASSVILVPGEVMQALNAVLREIPHTCQDLDRLPDLTFHMGGSKFAIPATAYMVEENSWGIVECKPLVKSVDRPSYLGPVWSLGLPFLRHYYVVFDRTGPSLHISLADGKCAAQRAMATASMQGAAPQAHFLSHNGTSREKHRRARRVDLRHARLPTWAYLNNSMNFERQ